MAEQKILEQRVEALKLLRQGEGMTIERIKDVLSADQRRAFISGETDPTAEEVFNLIRWSALSMLEDQYSAAIKNALAIGENVVEGNLTERRMYMLDVHNIKTRTLSNYEDVGAELLAQQVDITKKIRQDLGTIDVMEVAASVERLKARVERSEEENRSLRFTVMAMAEFVMDEGFRGFAAAYVVAPHIPEISQMSDEERKDFLEEKLNFMVPDEAGNFSAEQQSKQYEELVKLLLPPSATEVKDEDLDKTIGYLLRYIGFTNMFRSDLETQVSRLRDSIKELEPVSGGIDKAVNLDEPSADRFSQIERRLGHIEEDIRLLVEGHKTGVLSEWAMVNKEQPKASRPPQH